MSSSELMTQKRKLKPPCPAPTPEGQGHFASGGTASGKEKEERKIWKGGKELSKS